jgi:3-dehydroquinate synthase
MHCEARLAGLLGYLDVTDVDRIRSLIDSYGLPTVMPHGIPADRLIAPMTRDKKAVAGELKFILPEKIGHVKITGIADTEKIVESIGLC